VGSRSPPQAEDGGQPPGYLFLLERAPEDQGGLLRDLSQHRNVLRKCRVHPYASRRGRSGARGTRDGDEKAQRRRRCLTKRLEFGEGMLRLRPRISASSFG